MTDNDLKMLKEFLVGYTIVAVMRDDSRQVPTGLILILEDGRKLSLPVKDVVPVAESTKMMIT
jgi:hypothetical protein